MQAQGMSDRYQSFIEEHSKSLEDYSQLRNFYASGSHMWRAYPLRHYLHIRHTCTTVVSMEIQWNSICEELQSVTKGPALVDLRLIVAKIKKLGRTSAEPRGGTVETLFPFLFFFLLTLSGLRNVAFGRSSLWYLYAYTCLSVTKCF